MLVNLVGESRLKPFSFRNDILWKADKAQPECIFQGDGELPVDYSSA